MPVNSVDSLLLSLNSGGDFSENVAYSHTASARSAEFREWPNEIPAALRDSLHSMGIDQLYSHQHRALILAGQAKNLVIATGTASGKTLCYNLPVLQQILTDPLATALYLFPTKALTNDQKDELLQICRLLGSPPAISVYDGDTPTTSRREIREKSRILLTNPDMLHTGILPHHTNWYRFFSGLRFVVIDEMHTYRGVFGSHVCNVIRRLKRVAAFYGAYPQFILTSATIGNPVELAEKLIEAPVELIHEDGSARGPKHFLIYNPPVQDIELGVRKSAYSQCLELAEDLLEADIQTVVFARSRKTVEQFIRDLRIRQPQRQQQIRGYRSGYLPKNRREIEHSLRSGDAHLVAATNALELGIDIGGLNAVLLMGYPGTIAATRQQAGRAGRKEETALAVFVASASPIDQFLTRHPEFLVDHSPETALIDPNNFLILLNHIRCAAFELAFRPDEKFGHLDPGLLEEFLRYLLQMGILVQQNGQYYWMADEYPASNLSLRSASTDVIALQSVEAGKGHVIGVMDLSSALWMVHPGAVYLHEGESYFVEALDLEQKTAHMTPRQTEYFTKPIITTTFTKISELERQAAPLHDLSFGDIQVSSKVVGFQRLLWGSLQILDANPLDLPSTDLRTTASWWSILPEAIQRLEQANLWRNSPNNYGPGWERIRKLVLGRDQYQCKSCGLSESQAGPLHVHHIRPFRLFASPLEANRLENLVSLCPTCHRRAETSVLVRSGMAGLTYLLQQIASLFVMCDPMDLGAISDAQCPLADNQPAIVIYDQIPAGIGLSRKVYEQSGEILRHAREIIRTCSCLEGCPSCVGPAAENGVGAKDEALALVDCLLEIQNG